VVYLERLRLADSRPLAIMRNWLPPRFADIAAADLIEHGLYRLLGERNARPAVAKQRITATAARVAEARLLGTKRNAPLISMQRTAFDAAGLPVEFGDHLYRADLYAIEVTVFNR
jgi:DNA-binding GntR family transcriptional regulator